MEKFFYFRTKTSVNDDEDYFSSLVIPISKVTGIQALGDNSIIIYWETELHDVGDSAFGDQYYANANVTINIKTGSRKLVMQSIAVASNSGPHNDGLVIIADDVKNIYADGGLNIISCGNIVTSNQLGPDVDSVGA